MALRLSDQEHGTILDIVEFAIDLAACPWSIRGPEFVERLEILPHALLTALLGLDRVVQWFGHHGGPNLENLFHWLSGEARECVWVCERKKTLSRRPNAGRRSIFTKLASEFLHEIDVVYSRPLLPVRWLDAELEGVAVLGVLFYVDDRNIAIRDLGDLGHL